MEREDLVFKDVAWMKCSRAFIFDITSFCYEAHIITT